MTTLKSLAKKIQTIENSKGHKWSWEILDRGLNLLHDELSEVSNAWRNDDKRKAIYELADSLIRILHCYADCFPEADIDFVVANIMEKNQKRVSHHGRKRNPFESGFGGSKET